MVEWLKAPASKAGRRDERLESSNLSLSEVKTSPAKPGSVVFTASGMQRLNPGRFEEYVEVISGAFIAVLGVAFPIWPFA